MRGGKKRAWVRGAVVIAVLAASVTAQGQPAPKGAPPPAADPVVAEVARRFDLGQAYIDKKEWSKAAEELGKAYALRPWAQIAGNLGEAELQLGRFRDAAEHLEKFLREGKDIEPAYRKDAERWLATAKKSVATLKIVVSGGGAAAGAAAAAPEVLIDDKGIGMSPVPPEVYVEPGKHTVVARVGTARDELTDQFAKGTIREVKLSPKPAAAVGPTAAASATATTTTTTTTSSTATGSGDATGPDVEPTGPRKEILIAGLAVAGAAVVVGAVFAGVAASKAGEADPVRKGLNFGDCTGTGQPAECDNLLALGAAERRWGSGSAWAFGGALVVGAATLGYWYLAPRKTVTGEQPLRAGAAVSTNGGKVVLEGSW